MVVVLVLLFITFSIIYAIIRLKLQSCIVYERMDLPKEKRRRDGSNKQPDCNRFLSQPPVTLDLTEDEDDSRPSTSQGHPKRPKRNTSFELPTDVWIESSRTSTPKPSTSQASGTSQAGIFLDTTDDSDSDEENLKSLPKAQLKHHIRKPLFRWHNKSKANKHMEAIDLTEDSDSPESKPNPPRRVFTIKSKIKKEKASLDIKQEPNQLLPIFKEPKVIPLIEETKKMKLSEDICELMMSGVKVKLPVNPYSSQKAVMAKVIQGCTKKQHCLLESPTGSGKTLALLCGSLAWQDHYAAELAKERKKNSNKELPPKQASAEVEGSARLEAPPEQPGKSTTVPKIFYGTRTHRQIAQVVHELNKTAYRNKRMTILSSREHTCIRQEQRNKTEMCNELLDPTKPGSCEFYTENSKTLLSSFAGLSHHGLNGVWDIEDLMTLGRKQGACPYFAARSLMPEADIIFCPYNYLLDPDIRESMQLNLINQIIILDEAHNIEDICRESASVDLREDRLMQIFYEFKELLKQNKPLAPALKTAMSYVQALASFLNQVQVLEYDNYTGSACSKYWTGLEAIQLFNIHKIGVNVFVSVIDACQIIIMDHQRKKDIMRDSTPGETIPMMSLPAKSNLEHLLFILNMLQSEQHVNDYRICVMESTVTDLKTAPLNDSTWTLPAKKGKDRVRTIKFMCMNPAVTFAPLADSARTIILASGTLSPTSSFQSELGRPFPQTLNANHVIHEDQIYASYITKGPTGTALRATYQNVNQFTFQDELGRVLLDICETIPHGVLIFFSSYKMMDMQINRWTLGDIWKKLSSHKKIFTEPRSAGNLSLVMDGYRKTIKDTSSSKKGEVTGALLLGVFRGKVAEGIDFSDNEARCVVTVGIPYAVANDPIVMMKKEYNRRYSVSKGLLNDQQWYVVQAFRALNQALGRCIRHKNDWGAVLMIDERFEYEENRNYLPKWIKLALTHPGGYNLKEELHHFVDKQTQRDTQYKS